MSSSSAVLECRARTPSSNAQQTTHTEHKCVIPSMLNYCLRKTFPHKRGMQKKKRSAVNAIKHCSSFQTSNKKSVALAMTDKRSLSLSSPGILYYRTWFKLSLECDKRCHSFNSLHHCLEHIHLFREAVTTLLKIFDLICWSSTLPCAVIHCSLF